LQNNSRGSSGYRAGSGQVNGSFTKNEKRYTEEEEEQRQKILNRVIHYAHNELYKFNNVIFFFSTSKFNRNGSYENKNMTTIRMLSTIQLTKMVIIVMTLVEIKIKVAGGIELR
jgi:hypothetical protein